MPIKSFINDDLQNANMKLFISRYKWVARWLFWWSIDQRRPWRTGGVAIKTVILRKGVGVRAIFYYEFCEIYQNMLPRMKMEWKKLFLVFLPFFSKVPKIENCIKQGSHFSFFFNLTHLNHTFFWGIHNEIGYPVHVLNEFFKNYATGKIATHRWHILIKIRIKNFLICIF